MRGRKCGAFEATNDALALLLLLLGLLLLLVLVLLVATGLELGLGLTDPMRLLLLLLPSLLRLLNERKLLLLCVLLLLLLLLFLAICSRMYCGSHVSGSLGTSSAKDILVPGKNGTGTSSTVENGSSGASVQIPSKPGTEGSVDA